MPAKGSGGQLTIDAILSLSRDGICVVSNRWDGSLSGGRHRGYYFSEEKNGDEDVDGDWGNGSSCLCPQSDSLVSDAQRGLHYLGDGSPFLFGLSVGGGNLLLGPELFWGFSTCWAMPM